MLLCYLTNPFVILLADEEGEIKNKFFHLWQTWDSSLDNQHYIEEYAFKCIRYDFSKYYIQEEVPLYEGNNRLKWKSTLINPNFTTTDRIKRYLCRLCWVYRNCSYGFSYYLFSVETVPSKLKYIYRNETKDGKTYIVYETGHSLWNTPWAYYSNMKINKYIEWCNYLGWKIVREPEDSDKKFKCMIANRIAIHRRDK